MNEIRSSARLTSDRAEKHTDVVDADELELSVTLRLVHDELLPEQLDLSADQGRFR